MSSRPPDLSRNALRSIIPDDPRLNALAPIAQDVARVALPGVATPPPPHTISPLPPEQQGWFQDLLRRGQRWAQDNKVPDIKQFPPIRLLYAVLGENPLENVEGGPAKAIASFAARNPRMVRMLADPGFENFIMRHGPYSPGFARANSPASMGRNAPEGVIEDLWAKYQATPEAKRSAARVAERRAREVGEALGRRASDPPSNVLAPIAELPLDDASRMQRAAEQGFDVNTPLYHGTRDPYIEAFEPGHHNSYDAGWMGRGTYATTDPEVASAYAFMRKGPESQNVMPLYARGNFFDAPSMYYKQPGAIIEKRDGIEAAREWSAKRAEELQSHGYDGVRLTYPDGQIEYVIFDPKNVRSKFAKFDPAKKESRNILAGLAGVSAGGAVAATRDRKR